MRKLASCFLLAAMVFAGPGPKKKISSDLKNVAKGGTVQVIVQWNTSAGAGTAQKIAALGGTVISEFATVHSGVYLIPATALDALEADGDVKFVSVDRQIKKKTAALQLHPPQSMLLLPGQPATTGKASGLPSWTAALTMTLI